MNLINLINALQCFIKHPCHFQHTQTRHSVWALNEKCWFGSELHKIYNNYKSTVHEYSKQFWISCNTIIAHTVHFKIMVWSHYNFQMQSAHTHTLARSICHFFFCTWFANVLKIISFVYATNAAYIIFLIVTAWHKHVHTDTLLFSLSLLSLVFTLEKLCSRCQRDQWWHPLLWCLAVCLQRKLRLQICCLPVSGRS